MLTAIGHGLRNLFNFNGRDARQAFWFYVLFIYLVTTAIGLTISIPMAIQAITAGIEQGVAQAGNPDRAAPDAAAQGAIVASMSGYIPLLVWVSFGSAVIVLVGLAASLVRRLHDSGLSGYWALLPLGLQAVNAALIPGESDKIEQAMMTQLAGPAAGTNPYEGAFTAATAASWAAIVIVIVLATRKSTPGPNRFGEAPFIA